MTTPPPVERAPVSSGLRHRDRLTIDHDRLAAAELATTACLDLAVDGHGPVLDEQLGVTTGLGEVAELEEGIESDGQCHQPASISSRLG